MNIFVYEAISGGDAGAELESSLRIEGLGMLRSIVDDFARIHEVERVTTLVTRSAAGALLDRPEPVPARSLARINVRSRERPGASELRALARAADATLVIAPETDGILERLSRAVIEAGGFLIGSEPGVAALCGDKLALAGHLRSRDVPTPVARPIDSASGLDLMALPVVIKPRYGAGATHTYVARLESDAEDALLRARRATPLVATPLVVGRAVSASFLVSRRRTISLAAGEQWIAGDVELRYEGGRVPLESPEHSDRASRLARAAVDAVEGLRGFVGVDLVLGASPRDDAVIEINPRVTSSFPELRRHHAPWSITRAWLELVGLVEEAATELHG